MADLGGVVAYANDIALAALDGVVVVSRRLDFPAHSVLVVQRLDKHIPYLGVAYVYHRGLGAVLPRGVEVNLYRLAVVILQHLSEKIAEIFEIERDVRYLLVGQICPCRELLYFDERPAFELIDGPMLEREVYRCVEAVVTDRPLRDAQRHDVFLALELYGPVIRKVGNDVAVYLYIRSDGFLAHVRDIRRRLAQGDVLFAVLLRKVKFCYIGYQCSP